MKALCMVAIAVGIAGGSPAFAADTSAHLLWTDVGGTTYYLSTGSSSGVCWSTADSAEIHGKAGCVGESGYASAKRGGCGEIWQQGSCVLVRTLQDPRPTGTTSMRCQDGTIYLLSAGPAGQCTAVEQRGGSLSCRQQGTTNFASATCQNGCGEVSGTGSCLIK